MIFTLPEIYDTIVAARDLAKLECRIVTVKTKKGESVPNGAIDFTELMSTKGMTSSLICCGFDYQRFIPLQMLT